jgi:hypothetical protein
MFGGVSRGVLSLQHNAQWAGSIAVLGIPVVAFFIDKKISRDHLEYAKIRRPRARKSLDQRILDFRPQPTRVALRPWRARRETCRNTSARFDRSDTRG